MGYLEDNAGSGPHGPTEIAKALERSWVRSATASGG